MNELIIVAIAIAFAINMGASGITPTFSAEYGGGVISRKWASILFAVFVLLGAYTLGYKVVKVIGSKLIDPSLIDVGGALCIFIGTTTAMFISNLMRIPASTSQITVFSIIGFGLISGPEYVNWAIFKKLIPLWFVLPLSALAISFAITKLIYPKIRGWRGPWVRFWDIVTSCYTAFSIGSNNVANAAGVLSVSGIMTGKAASFLLAPFFGLGGFILGLGNLESIGKKMVKLDIPAAAIISLITGTLLISASLIGLPQSLVQLNVMAVLGFYLAEKGLRVRESVAVIRNCFAVWFVSPAIGMMVAVIAKTML